jgi:rhodanese-related sulfurtransferase
MPWLIPLAAFLAFVVPHPTRDEGVLTAVEARELAVSGKAVLIDIRRPDEWRATGIPAGARRADASQKDGPAGFLNDVLEITGDRRDVTLVLICRTGNRTARARAFLLSKGFAEVYHVKEGVAGSEAGPGWFRRGLPVEPCNC